MNNEELLFNEIYDMTKSCGRTQFVRLLMAKERENQELRLQLKGTTHCYDEEEHKRLQQENQKYKEVIDKVSTRLEYFLIGNSKYQSSQEEFIKLLNILKEVE